MPLRAYDARMGKVILILLAVLLAGNALWAHGGRYRAPPVVRKVVKDPRLSSGPGAPRPPLTPGGGAPGPTTPGSAGPAGPFTPSGSLRPDLGRWQVWWSFNKDPFLLLRNAVYGTGGRTHSDLWYLGARRPVGSTPSLAPSKHQRQQIMLPALQRALQSGKQPDLVTACLMALAKLDLQDEDLLALLRSHLKSDQQEIRETAALAMGLSAMPQAWPDLQALLLDGSKGRRLLGDGDVDDRTRSFAAYGLGLLGRKGTPKMKAQVWEVLAQMLEAKDLNRQTRVAVVNAMGVLNLSAEGKGRRLLWQAMDSLQQYYAQDLGQGDQLVQAHVPIALGRLLKRGDSADHQRLKQQFVAELGRSSGRNNLLQQSAALALGALSLPTDLDIHQALRQYYKNGNDRQARSFCLIAMGRIGGEANRSFLLQALRRGKKVMEKPWAALALGVLMHQQEPEQGEEADEADLTMVGDALAAELRKARNKDLQGALSVALGLAGFKEAGSLLRQVLSENQNQNELAGFICIGLALMGEEKAVPEIRHLVQKSVRRPELLRRAAVALGKLGDKGATELLLAQLGSQDSDTARLAAVASAMGLIGDFRMVQPLRNRLTNPELSKLSRAFVAGALGEVAYPGELPWSACFAAGSSYRASVETLTNQQTGLLDIL